MRKYLSAIIVMSIFGLCIPVQGNGIRSASSVPAGSQATGRPAVPKENPGYPSVRYLSGPRAEWQGDSLLVRFSSEITGRLKGPSSLHFIPIYVSGKDTIRYPELGYFTPSGAKYHKRRSALSDKKTDGTVRILYRSGRGGSDYRESMVIPSSVKGELRLLEVLRGCCDSLLQTSQTIAIPARTVVLTDTVYTTVPGMLPLPVAAVSVPLFEMNVTFIEPRAETIKERTATATVRITYPVNHWKVYPAFGVNTTELARVDNILSPVATDTATYRVLGASITGYASPEDTYEHNMTLSEQRSGGMRDYLQDRYGFPVGKIAVQGKGEDWNGLREAVEQSDMAAKEAVLTIIDSYDVFDGREKRLMDLQGGDPYTYMLHTLFPPLRRLEMQIDYRVRAFGTDEAGELIGHRPQDLSLREMYTVAEVENDNQTILRQRSEYGREYDIAVRYFPDDDIANINASSAALVRGDLEQAWQCLGKVKENPISDNNLGVYHWLCGKIEDAKAYFRRALSTDPERAAYNLEQLQKWEDQFGAEATSEPDGTTGRDE